MRRSRESMDDELGSDLRIVHDEPQWKKLMRDKRVWIGSGVGVLALVIVIIIAASVGKKEDSESKPNNPNPPPPPEKKDWTKYCVQSSISTWRLPTSVTPSGYSITVYNITLDPTFTFSGIVAINVSVAQETSCIQLHASSINFQSLSVSFNGKDVPIASRSLDTTTDIMTLQFNQLLDAASKGVISASYIGVIHDDMHGFYRAQYRGLDNKTHWLAMTQFESVAARRAFPCFDEPAFKATYDLSIVVPNTAAVHSNMPLQRNDTYDAGNWKVTFQRTPLMSSYLLAWIMAPDGLDQTVDDINGTAYGTVSVPGLISQTEFARYVEARAIAEMARRFNFSFPLPKIDSVAAPDFNAGAMENFGLMTFRDRAILVNDDTTSTDLDYVLRVVVHESAHQWFGDIVTAAWWSDLTVNEGFATLWEYYIADALEPSWEILGQTYLVNELEALLEEDALASSHPLMNPSVQTKGDIDSMFDAISYNKGSAVWRMLMDYVHADKFMSGMQLFLQRHQYKMATVADVVQAVQDASQIGDVVQRFTAWTTKAGYPVLSVSYDGVEGKLSVAQTSAIANDTSTAWFVDLKMLSSSEPNTPATNMITETRAATQFSAPKNASWIKLNAGMTYLCRVKYEESMWLAFADAITGGKTAALSVVGDRFEIMNDVFAFSATNDVKISTVLTLVRALSQETEFAVWSTTLAQLSKWAVLIREQPFYGRFQSFVRSVTKVALDAVGFDPQPQESIQVAKVRSLLYATAVSYGDSVTTSLLADAYKNETLQLNADQKNVAYSAYVKVGGDAAYWEMVDRLSTSKSPGETYRVLRALASPSKPSLLQNSLTIALDPKYVRPQDTYAAFGYVASSVYGYRLAWDNLRSNWQQFEQRYGAGYTIGRFISAATASFDTPELLAEFDLFFATHRPAAGIPAIQQARERILSNIQWRQTNMAILQQWLEDNNYPLY